MNESQFGTMDEPGDGFFADLTVYGDENIAGDIAIGGNLSVTGTSELILTETLMGDLIMGDATTKGGNIQVYRDAAGNLGFDYQPGVSLALTDLLSMAAAYKVQFRDAAIYVQSADDGHLDITADTSIDLNAATVITGSYLSVGTNPAASGVIRIPNASYLYGRNAANSADVQMWGISSGNLLYTGSETHIANYLYLGTNPAQSGQLRLPNNVWITGRNAANNADVNMFMVDASNMIEAGASILLPAGSDLRLSNSTAATTIKMQSAVAGDANYRFQIQADGKMLWGDGTNAADTNLYRPAANILTTDDALYVTSTIRGGDLKTLPSSASVKTNYDHLTIQNMPQAIDMDGTEASIAWTQRYYDQTTPAYVTAGRIGVFTESDWTSVASTQDASMRFSVAINGVVTEVARLTSGGQLQLPNTGTTTAGILVGGDCLLYRSAANNWYTDDIFTIATYLYVNNTIFVGRAGTAKANIDVLDIINNANAADMDATEHSILFRQKYYDATTPLTIDAARITFGTETDWTSNAATQDGYLKFSVVVNGTVTEMMRIASTGNISAVTGGFINDYDSGDYNADWSGYTPPTGINGLVVVAHNTNGSGSDRLYWYAGSAWHYVNAA